MFPRLDDMRNCHLACYSDASFANLPGEGSQGGMVILLHDGQGIQCPILWQTRKIRRVVKSTLAAETGAIDCAEEANHMATLISKLLGTQKPSVHCYVDKKRIVDAVTSSGGYEWKLLRFKRCWNEGNSLRFHGFHEISNWPIVSQLLERLLKSFLRQYQINKLLLYEYVNICKYMCDRIILLQRTN